jgi:hypothetical protein
MLKIDFTGIEGPYGMCVRVPCAICGNGAETENISSHIYEDGEEVGYVCRQCEKLSREELVRELLNTAEYHEQQQRRLKEMATIFSKPSTPINFPVRSISEESLLHEISLLDFDPPKTRLDIFPLEDELPF